MISQFIPSKRRYFNLIVAAVIFLGAATLLSGYASAQSLTLTPIEELGKYVFFDKISNPPRMACVTCHDPATGGTGSVSGVNLHQVAITGANPHRVGNLKPPTNAYASFISEFKTCSLGGSPRGAQYCGGNFWNGRAEGIEPLLFLGATEHIGEEVFNDDEELKSNYVKYLGPVADQALNPFTNPVEQNIERLGVCQHVESAKYAPLFEIVWKGKIDCGSGLDKSYKRIAVALAAWQASAEVNSFSSKRDIALRAELACLCVDPQGSGYPGDNVCGIVSNTADPTICEDESYLKSPGKFPLVGLTDQENYGHDLFYATPRNPLANGKFANCTACHSDNPATDTGDELFQLYADDAYHNIGTPVNPEIPGNLGPNDGLAAHTDVLTDSRGGLFKPVGLFKTPTLRNVDKRPGKGFTKAYTHNGWFKSLESIVHFYNTAFLGNCVITITPDEDCTGRFEVSYEETTAFKFGVTRCPPEITTEKDALANNCWPAPGHPGTPRGTTPTEPGPGMPFLFGNLDLDAEDEAALVAYLKTFTDTYTPKQPKPYK